MSWLYLWLVRRLSHRQPAPPPAVPAPSPSPIATVTELHGRCCVCGQSRSSCPHWRSAC
ncbi:hypothetical protein BCF44_109159 [Kutzneria buriramensis]|uniref:Uncharacterized protein n=1 Tax=Kutzneria buriramensis TaxID=1045776 RepID=A0A3E0HEZ4_9PSEU|nr:hypothetical protein BCF44_109159 [Kutzneria buriramensis]